MSAKTVRQQLVEKVQARFGAITIANGYQTDIGERVFRCRPVAPTDKEAEAGALNIWDLVEESKPALSFVYEHKLTFDTYIAKVGSGVDEFIRNVIGDLAKAVAVDERWDGLAIRSEMGKSEYEIDQDKRLTGTVKFSFSIIYRTEGWDFYNVA